MHTGSFDKEMSKCASLCVSVSVSVCLAPGGQGADVMCVCVCDAVFGQSCLPLGRRCGPRALGIRGLMCVGGWAPSPRGLSTDTEYRKERKKKKLTTSEASHNL